MAKLDHAQEGRKNCRDPAILFAGLRPDGGFDLWALLHLPRIQDHGVRTQRTVQCVGICGSGTDKRAVEDASPYGIDQRFPGGAIHESPAATGSDPTVLFENAKNRRGQAAPVSVFFDYVTPRCPALPVR